MARSTLRLIIGCWLALGSPAAYCFGAPRVQKTGGVIHLSSPDGRIRFSFQASAVGMEYGVSFKGNNLIDHSPLSLSFQQSGAFGKGLTIQHPLLREGEDNYQLVVGKTHSVHDHYRELTIPLEERSGHHRKINLIVRAFNDGLAFRYEFLRLDEGLTDTVSADNAAGSSIAGSPPSPHPAFQLTDESTSFHLSGDPTLLASFRPSYTTSHEGRYTRLPLSQMREDSLMDMPILVQYPNQVYVAITEAQLVDYAGMYLIKQDGSLKSELSPLPGQDPTPPGDRRPVSSRSVKVKAILPHQTPWRVLLISDRPGALIESNILTSLNDSCAIRDLSWIRPGKTDFHWWNGDIVPDTTFPPGLNFETNQYYIDFCARNGLQYHTVIGYGGVAWYTNDGISYQPGRHSDVTKPVPGLDMSEICGYAKERGVDIRVWVHWQALYPMLDKAFTQFEAWGVKGMMVDFMDRDDQEMVNIQTEILQKAALHHLHIQFHGAYKPTGLSRTWPNEFTREGTLNYENDKWNNPITPDDDINVVFTRLLAGATDYHLGGFRAVTAADYIPQYTRPLVLGTRCHMLAMYVILESYLGMVCDYPAAYEGQPGFDFLKAVPTTWDETRVPAASPGQWVTIARRKGSDWFVGTISNGEGRSVTIPLNFLPPGSYEATGYKDADDAAIHPNHLTKEIRTVQSTDSLTLTLAPGGGQVLRLTKKE